MIKKFFIIIFFILSFKLPVLAEPENTYDGIKYDISQINENIISFTNTTILGLYSPLLLKDNTKGLWTRPYVSYDKVNIGNGQHVDLTMYGNLLGFETDPKTWKNNWQATYLGYVGYRGNRQNYDSEENVSNMGLAGGAVSFYNKDFFGFLALDAGGGKTFTNYSRDINSFSTNAALRLGYNINLKNNITVQPNYIMSYTYAKTFNSTDNSGNPLTTKDLNAVQISPSLRVFANLKNDFKPFLIIDMVFPVLSNEFDSVRNVPLPEISLYPFIEYGGGVQKKWENGSSAFIQLLMRNGGRTGVGLLLGVKYPVGKM